MTSVFNNVFRRLLTVKAKVNHHESQRNAIAARLSYSIDPGTGREQRSTGRRHDCCGSRSATGCRLPPGTTVLAGGTGTHWGQGANYLIAKPDPGPADGNARIFPQLFGRQYLGQYAGSCCTPSTGSLHGCCTNGAGSSAISDGARCARFFRRWPG